MEQKNETAGIGFLGALTVAFIVLKLTNVINWSWWIVLSPMLIPIIIVIACLLFLFYLKNKRRK